LLSLNLITCSLENLTSEGDLLLSELLNVTSKVLGKAERRKLIFIPNLNLLFLK
jgi:hypothetical protein